MAPYVHLGPYMPWSEALFMRPSHRGPKALVGERLLILAPASERVFGNAEIARKRRWGRRITGSHHHRKNDTYVAERPILPGVNIYCPWDEMWLSDPGDHWCPAPDEHVRES